MGSKMETVLLILAAIFTALWVMVEAVCRMRNNTPILRKIANIDRSKLRVVSR